MSSASYSTPVYRLIAGSVAAVRNAALRSISASCDGEMPSARRQADRSAANSTRPSTREARNDPSAGELSVSNDRGGPVPPARLVSDGGNSTITVVTLAQGLARHRPCVGSSQRRGYPRRATAPQD